MWGEFISGFMAWLHSIQFHLYWVKGESIAAEGIMRSVGVEFGERVHSEQCWKGVWVWWWSSYKLPSLSTFSGEDSRDNKTFNPLGAMAYIYARARLPLTAMSIYICTQYKQVPTALSCQAKQDCGVNPYLMSSNKSRPHLSTYITTRKGQEGAVLMCEWSWILTRASKSEAFSRTNGANSLQFSLKAEVLPSNNLEMSRNFQGCR